MLHVQFVISNNHLLNMIGRVIGPSSGSSVNLQILSYTKLNVWYVLYLYKTMVWLIFIAPILLQTE